MNHESLAVESLPKKKEKSKFREYAEALLTAILIAVFLRSFVVEAFKIPSGSMIPTLMVGDHIFVNKFIYGIRVPFTSKWLWKYKEPQRGEAIVFIYPKDHSLDYIKRVVGLPGDRVRIDGDDVYVNDQKLEVTQVPVIGKDPKNQLLLDLSPPADVPGADKFKKIPVSEGWSFFRVYLEKLGDHLHLKQEAPRQEDLNREFLVPADNLFVMGDNRDNSQDSRYWGFVPIENVKGKAMFIWLSLRYREDRPEHGWAGFRWDRFGQWIQ
ncbi:MAG TPA: signal peptidase I [bacterium]|nr:signal peptidase I [bacterium]